MKVKQICMMVLLWLGVIPAVQAQTFDKLWKEVEQAALAFICKRLKLNLKKLSEEEKKWLKKIAQKSDLLKNPNPQRGRK